MSEKMVIGNGIVAPLTYETMEAAEEGGYRVQLAIEKGILDEKLLTDNLEEWFRQTQKYYIVPVTPQEIMNAADEGTYKLREAIQKGEVDMSLIETDLQEWFRQTRKYYLPE